MAALEKRFEKITARALSAVKNYMDCCFPYCKLYNFDLDIEEKKVHIFLYPETNEEKYQKLEFLFTNEHEEYELIPCWESTYIDSLRERIAKGAKICVLKSDAEKVVNEVELTVDIISSVNDVNSLLSLAGELQEDEHIGELIQYDESGSWERLLEGICERYRFREDVLSRDITSSLWYWEEDIYTSYRYATDNFENRNDYYDGANKINANGEELFFAVGDLSIFAFKKTAYREYELLWVVDDRNPRNLFFTNRGVFIESVNKQWRLLECNGKCYCFSEYNGKEEEDAL